MYRLIKKHYLLLLIIFSQFSLVSGQTGNIYLPDTTQWQVLIDDSLVLSTSRPSINLPVGKYRLLFEPVNDKNWMTIGQKSEIIVKENQKINVLSAKPQFNKVSLMKRHKIAGKRAFYLDRNEKRNRRKYIKPVFLGAAVVSNWASFLIKRKADDYYGIYKKTSDLDRMNKYYNRSSDYDIYANIMLGVSAAALTAYFYYILTD
ncbi:MAG: hypothetical protein P8X42_01490 [Calditrichaceae bacterium]